MILNKSGMQLTIIIIILLLAFQEKLFESDPSTVFTRV